MTRLKRFLPPWEETKKAQVAECEVQLNLMIRLWLIVFMQEDLHHFERAYGYCSRYQKIGDVIMGVNQRECLLMMGKVREDTSSLQARHI
jgi:hypothetical protein